jgi:hypothetical protein
VHLTFSRNHCGGAVELETFELRTESNGFSFQFFYIRNSIANIYVYVSTIDSKTLKGENIT